MTDIRIGDEERSRAGERLAEHAAAGRLTVAELEERLERVNAAVFERDLIALEADLPGPPAPRPRPAALSVPWLAVLLLVAAIAGSFAVGHPLPPLFILAFLLWRRASRRPWTAGLSRPGA